MKKFVLASASPRRKMLLEEIGAAFTVCPADVDERQIVAETPEETVKKLALCKARYIFERLKDGKLQGCTDVQTAVLGADSVVVAEGKILGKPADAAEAVKMLNMLSGKVHEVKTGIAFLTQEKTYSECVTTRVYMNELGEDFIARYVATGSPLDKAGAYGIQDGGLAEKTEGSYSNVIGLPLERVEEILKAEGFLDR